MATWQGAPPDGTRDGAGRPRQQSQKGRGTSGSGASSPGASGSGASGSGASSTGNASSAPAPAFSERKEERQRLVDLLRRAGIGDERVLAAIGRVPRHAFVPASHRAQAYDNIALPLAEGQTVSQPFVVASMTELAALGPSSRCLEIGTGSGYQAAVLAEVCRSVFSIEFVPELCALGERNLRALGYGPERIRLRAGDGSRGWPEEAPWDAIVVTAAPSQVPRPLLEQLAVGGRLVIPVGGVHEWQQLELWQRVAPGYRPESFRQETLYGVRFVPLVGGPEGGA